MAGIWAEVLKIERVGRHDNFFELGGHSLLAVRVVNLLQRININILAADLFTHPTIESLVAKTKLHGRQDQANRAICMRKGGTECPLFLTHDSLGELIYIPHLAPHIGTTMPIYGLSSQPKDEAPLQTVEGIAARMVKMIRAVQPVGPYRVAGFSMGGVFAYEVVAQL